MFCLNGAGDPFYTIFIDFFCDDVSGNRSKSWNKHWNIYITNRNLPRQMIFQERHIHFISTSQHASASEQFYSLKKAIESTHTDPIHVRDGCSGQSTCFQLHGQAGTSDNPAQSEIAAHIGQNGRFPCWKCKAGGDQKHLGTCEWYLSFFEVNLPHLSISLFVEILSITISYTKATPTTIEDRQRDSGVKDVFTQYWINHLIESYRSERVKAPDRPLTEIVCKVETFVKENEDRMYSGFLTLQGFDPANDTPIEIPHTILLGIVKYVWYDSHHPWSKAQKATFETRLQATDQNGLSGQAIRAKYIMQYANSLIGRQLKTVCQTAVFHVYGLLNDDMLCIWRSVGELSALLWFPEIRDLKTYLEDVRVAAENVVDAFSVIDPNKITNKIKLHLLSHLPADIRRFGPLVGVATEGYEGWNAIFRFCSVLSNHLAPSCDIALQLADQEGLKQRLSQGWWYSPSAQEWQRSSPKVREFTQCEPILRRLLGWSDNRASACPGSVKLQSMDRRQNQRLCANESLGNTKAKSALNSIDYDMESIWYIGAKLVSQSLDDCPLGAWVAAKSPVHEQPVLGRVNCIFEQATAKEVQRIAVLELFHLSSSRHQVLGMPVLNRRHDEESYIIVQTKERQESDNFESFVEHNAVNSYIINLHSFHNAHLIRQVLLRDLTKPLPLFVNREEKHQEFVENYQKSKTSEGGRKQKKRKQADD
ncbi:hypothetical protein K435DRAFT_821397 [Dendrothele bispora CBS 962.96]|uniref:Uncharacterized protein n=1 Tax=Dendrothele bispora (strain CBS 962.96) TaxID=1314807 RepID=A0A4S8LJV1_DENBC|nr:hypothetical protein K435DRAFT_821397 [Dendrothele bispora CBS 962.96]